MSDKLERLVARLEAATSKLESLASKGGSSRPAAGDASEIVDGFENEFLNSDSLKKLKEAADKIGGEVSEATNDSIASLDELKKFIYIVGTHKMPKQSEIVNISKLLSESAARVSSFSNLILAVYA